ncbi:hypothetical protein VTL71DRAFT_7367 [Oculimacula yallundae]
MAILV